ncbi:transcription factor E2FA [Iris pallida]|uniref:Transcription factor E2FA n=1 Tax=Iris pallida TaxID=29817 RepID=A0AAX6GJ14_IRIPA|nr:transcription factor E2FA [Iris pallida]
MLASKQKSSFICLNMHQTETLEFALLESSSVDDDLAELKKEISGSSSSSQEKTQWATKHLYSSAIQNPK